MKKIALVIGIVLFFASISYAQPLPPPTGAVGEDILKEEEASLREFKQREKEKAPKEAIEEVPTEGKPPELKEGKKVFIKKIVVEGYTILKTREIQAIASEYEDKELSFSEVQELTDKLTNLYIEKGYVTSRFYVPPQEIKDGVLIIKAFEGKIGDVSVEGNRYFKSRLITRKFKGYQRNILNTKEMERALRYLNLSADRKIKAVLSPGEKPATTDVLLNVKDKTPWHFTMRANNRGTEFTGKQRYGAILRNTNLLGFDDFFTFSYQMAQRDQLYAWLADYNIPVNRWGAKIGMYGSYVDVDIGRELGQQLQLSGRFGVGGVYTSIPIVDTMETDFDISFGFDYKDIKNFMLGMTSTQDDLRIAKSGMLLDARDRMGRTILSSEVSVGLDILGAMEQLYNQNITTISRLGADEKFVKWNGSVRRLQRLPFSSMMILDFQGQAADDRMASSEEIVIGGYGRVRGYPELEHLGDYGYVTSLEVRTPFWVFPSSWKLPFSKKKQTLRKSMQFVIFTDAGSVFRKDVFPGEAKNDFIAGTGVGVRIDFYDRLRGRLDWAIPLSAEPSDGADSFIYFGVEIDLI